MITWKLKLNTGCFGLLRFENYLKIRFAINYIL